MKITRLLTTASLACLGLVTTASANDDSGWYLRGNAGYGSHTDIDIIESLNGDVESEGNIAASLGAGYDFGNNWRVELDGNSLWTDLGAIGQQVSSAAKLRTNSLMLNAIYDFEGFDRFEPYIGAGLGFIQAQADASAHDFPSVDNALVRNPACVAPNTAGVGNTCFVNDNDTGFGWQLLAGLGYNINDNLIWDTNYKYQQSVEPFEFDGFSQAGAAAPVPLHQVKFNDVGSHSLLTGFRYRFGAAAPKAIVTPPAPVADYKCWDGAMVFNAGQCAAQPAPPPPPPPPVEYTDCPDGSVVVAGNACPVIPQVTYVDCPDGSVVVEGNACPVVRTNLNVCGSSNIGIFNVNTSATPKQMTRLGTLPEFGDSHGLSADQFFQKLQTRYSSNATDKAYLNYLFKSMGYANGFADAQSYMFSEEVLPVGTAGLLGLGKQHHYNYSILPSNDRDRQAFRIQSSNGQVVHFMKTCGNYFYGCE